MIKPQTLKGFRDFLPAEARKRQYVITTLKNVFELYGFEPLETPVLEYEEVLTGKYGEEGEKLMYRFEDNGQRRVAMRYDQTVPLARVVAQYQNELPTPFKRYQFQNVWRADKPQRGRYREFMMCDVDTVGLNSLTADSEILAVVNSSLLALGFTDYRILINDRKVFGDLPLEAIITIDKLKKIGAENVMKELQDRGLDANALATVQNATMTSDLETIIKTASEMGVKKENLLFEPTLARGLDYYTGLIFEVEIPAYAVGSVCGGGRYDKLLNLFINKQIPSVGFAFGFDRIVEAMNTLDLFPNEINAAADVLVTIMGNENAQSSIETASKLREAEITTELWLDTNAKMEKQLKYANEKRIPNVLIIGTEEKEKNIVTWKNMLTREQTQFSIDVLVSKLKK